MKRTRVLLIRNSDESPDSIVRSLGGFDFDVELSGSADDALLECEKNSYDAVLFDFDQLGFAGLQAAVRLKAFSDRKGNRLPLVAFSSSPAAAGDCLRAGINAFVKNRKAESLARAIKKQIAA